MTATLPDTWQITLPYKRPPLSQNDRGSHWKFVPIKKRIRIDVAWLARCHHVPALERAHIVLHWQPEVYRHRDTDNPAPTLKSCIDGLRDAHVLVDDDSTRVTSHVVIHDVARGTSARVWLQIRRVTA